MELAPVRFVLGVDLGLLGVPRAWGIRNLQLLHTDPVIRCCALLLITFLFQTLSFDLPHWADMELAASLSSIRFGSLGTGVLRAWGIRNHSFYVLTIVALCVDHTLFFCQLLSCNLPHDDVFYFAVVQIHATVLLYNYYHRKQFPQLKFADPQRFCMIASLTAGEALLVYLKQVHEHHDNGTGGGLSVTDEAVVDACNIAEALDATKDSPEMVMWPITKVAVLLLNRTKMCLVKHGSQTKGVYSIFEKDITMSLGGSHSSDVSVQESSNKSVALPSEPYVLQQIAYSEAELKTGSYYSHLQFIIQELLSGTYTVFHACTLSLLFFPREMQPRGYRSMS